MTAYMGVRWDGEGMSQGKVLIIWRGIEVGKDVGRLAGGKFWGFLVVNFDLIKDCVCKEIEK